MMCKYCVCSGLWFRFVCAQGLEEEFVEWSKLPMVLSE